jgi:hypothetical protein
MYAVFIQPAPDSNFDPMYTQLPAPTQVFRSSAVVGSPSSYEQHSPATAHSAYGSELNDSEAYMVAAMSASPYGHADSLDWARQLPCQQLALHPYTAQEFSLDYARMWNGPHGWICAVAPQFYPPIMVTFDCDRNSTYVDQQRLDSQ